MNAWRRVCVLPIRIYQRTISPLTPPSCRFEPSCSEYGAQAILAHGLVKGSLLGTWRILRCNPFCQGGHDPVPAPGRWRTRQN
jgi:putative membrane protein insertion efficiency factor